MYNAAKMQVELRKVFIKDSLKENEKNCDNKVSKYILKNEKKKTREVTELKISISRRFI